MEFNALMMLIIGLGLTWGGAVICISIAIKNRHKKSEI